MEGIASLIFTKYVFAFEITGALLITAAVGAMVLTHRERTERARTQRELSEQRVRDGKYLPPLPAPGVYARHNAVDIHELQRSINDLAGPEVAIRSINVVEQTFDARHSARSRLYRYTTLNSVHPDPFLARMAWHLEAELDLVVSATRLRPVAGEHDFASFCRRPKPRHGRQVSLVRRVLDARWEVAEGDVLHFWIEAMSFATRWCAAWSEHSSTWARATQSRRGERHLASCRPPAGELAGAAARVVPWDVRCR